MHRGMNREATKYRERGDVGLGVAYRCPGGRHTDMPVQKRSPLLPHINNVCFSLKEMLASLNVVVVFIE